MGVSISNTTILNLTSTYLNASGQNTTRILTSPYGHSNYWFPLGGEHVTVHWRCFYYARYLYADGTPEINRTYQHTHMRIH